MKQLPALELHFAAYVRSLKVTFVDKFYHKLMYLGILVCI